MLFKGLFPERPVKNLVGFVKHVKGLIETIEASVALVFVEGLSYY